MVLISIFFLTQIYYSIGKATALLRLTEDGTNFFKSYNSDDKKIFLQNLSQGLVDNIPLNDPTQIKFNNYVIDKSIINRRQLLLALLVNPPVNKNNKIINVKQIVKSLDAMIKNLEVTPLSSNDYTKYLDSSYGCIMNSRLFYYFLIHLLLL